MTWQEQLFRTPPTLETPFGKLPLEIQGEVVDAEDGDVFEARVYIRVVEVHAGKGRKMNDIGDRIGEPRNIREAILIRAFTELTRRVPDAEFNDMRHAELLVRQREQQDDNVRQHPRAV